MARLLVIATLLLACDTSCGAESSNGHATPDPSNQTGGSTAVDDADPLGIGFPVHGDATPTLLRIVNDRAEPIRLVISDGEGEPFEIGVRDGEPHFWLGSSGPLVSGESCACRCGFGCLQCEAPEYREHLVPPGEHFDFAWSGRVRVGDTAGGGCFHPYGAPPGPRTFTACLDDLSVDDRDCVSVEVELPAERIELHFGASDEPTYVTGLEIRAIDDSQSFGFAVEARYSPPPAAELRPPSPHPDAEDATGLLIGHRIATDDAGRGIGLAHGSAPSGSYALPRDGIPGPVDVVVSRDGVIVSLLELTPCEGCDPTPIEGEISLVLPAGTIRRLGIAMGSRMFAEP